MTAPHTKVAVPELPDCDFCGETAHYDGRTNMGPWANMCESCFHKHAKGLGLGIGQELVLEEKTNPDTE